MGCVNRPLTVSVCLSGLIFTQILIQYKTDGNIDNGLTFVTCEQCLVATLLMASHMPVMLGWLPSFYGNKLRHVKSNIRDLYLTVNYK